ncbi:hypothetical protein [Halorubrum sp. DM2]|uniref:hypothetical protein n=1 Tax=Halorubrum sp. DM2 TaxID=2527867 RepID=UPI0024B753F7|nr:hypothetical protein [Halorubrum sp. DM2]
MNKEKIPPVETEEVFLDTSVLYDYTKDTVQEAKTLFDEYPEINKITSAAGEREYRKVAERRAEAIKECEEFAAENQLSKFSFHSLDFLTPNDRGSLRQYRDKLLRNCSEAEALRRLNQRKRTYQRGVELLFDGKDALVTVRDLEFRISLEKQLQMDIDNGNDRRILCHAADWHAKEFGNAFATSDTGDFADEDGLGDYLMTDGGELPDSLSDLGSRPLIERINDSIQSEYSSEMWLHIVDIEQLLEVAG